MLMLNRRLDEQLPILGIESARHCLAIFGNYAEVVVMPAANQPIAIPADATPVPGRSGDIRASQLGS